MADNNTIIIDIQAKIDNLEKQVKKSIDNTSKQYANLGDDISSFINGGVGTSVISLAKKFAPLALGIYAIKEAIDLTFSGEKIKAIEQSFEILTKQAGLFGSTLKESLKDASAGLIDDTDLLNSANKAIIELGSNAKVIPETLDLARKASLAFGTDTIQTFELINSAIATGNVRSLRQIGITLDNDVVLKKYAKSIGVTVDTLTDAGRKQAVLNAVLEKGRTAFDGINPSAREATNAFQELKVQVIELKDELARSFSNQFSAKIAQGARDTADALFILRTKAKEASGDTLSVEDKIKQLTISLTDLQKRAESPTDLTDFFGKGEIQKQIKLTEQEIERLGLLQEKLNARNFVANRNATELAPNTGPKLFDQEKLDAENEKILTTIAQNNAAVLNLRQQGDNDLAAAERKKAADILLINQQFEDQKAQLIARYGADTVQSDALLKEQLVSAERLKNAKIDELQRQELATAIEVRKIYQSNVVNGLTSAFSQLGAALVKGTNGFEAFGKAVIGALGAMAIQIGTLLLTIGLGFQTLGPVLPVFGLSGAGAVAAGLGLIALGGVLSAIGGGEAGSPAGSGGGAGFSGAGGFVETSQQSEVDSNATRAKGTVVNVNVEGNILDRRQTGLEIANIIQEQFDVNGQVIAQGGIA